MPEISSNSAEFVALLKKQNRRLKKLLAAVPLAVILTFLPFYFYWTKDEGKLELKEVKRLKAEEILLVDEGGRFGAELSARKEGAFLRFYNVKKETKELAQTLLKVDSEGTFLRFYGENGNRLLSLGLKEGRPKVLLCDGSGMKRVILTVADEPGPLLLFLEEEGKLIESVLLKKGHF